MAHKLSAASSQSGCRADLEPSLIDHVQSPAAEDEGIGTRAGRSASAGTLARHEALR